jgi:hypothetical protein|nr:MAG TPA: hypothetical protein [Caudoviricetes sp.]
MERVNNKNGIEMYWEKASDVNKINILDSNRNYFNDQYFDEYENDNGAEDIGAIVHTLEETTLEEMCNYFNARKYNSLKELIDKEELYDTNETEILNNDYLNVFNVNGTTFYTYSW